MMTRSLFPVVLLTALGGAGAAFAAMPADTADGFKPAGMAVAEATDIKPLAVSGSMRAGEVLEALSTGAAGPESKKAV